MRERSAIRDARNTPSRKKRDERRLGEGGKGKKKRNGNARERRRKSEGNLVRLASIDSFESRFFWRTFPSPSLAALFPLLSFQRSSLSPPPSLSFSLSLLCFFVGSSGEAAEFLQLVLLRLPFLLVPLAVVALSIPRLFLPRDQENIKLDKRSIFCSLFLTTKEFSGISPFFASPCRLLALPPWLSSTLRQFGFHPLPAFFFPPSLYARASLFRSLFCFLSPSLLSPPPFLERATPLYTWRIRVEIQEWCEGVSK